MSIRPLDGGAVDSTDKLSVGVHGDVAAKAGGDKLGDVLDGAANSVDVGGAVKEISAAGLDLRTHVTGIARDVVGDSVGGIVERTLGDGGLILPTMSGGIVGDVVSGSVGGIVGTVAGGGIPDLAGMTPGIVGETLGGSVGGVAGELLGGGGANVGDVIQGAATSAISGAVGNIVDKAVTNAVTKVAGGVVGEAVGNLASGVATAVSAKAVDAALGGILGGKSKHVDLPAEMPIFEDIAVTSSVPGKLVDGVATKTEQRLTVPLRTRGPNPGGKNLEVEIASCDKLDVRQFSIQERLSSLFQVHLVVVSENPSIEFDEVVGQPAKFKMATGGPERFWSGVCNHLEQVRVEPSGLSTYQLSIVPTLWLLTQRKNYRMFQQISEPDIVLKLLAEWGIEPVLRIDKGAYKKRKYRVQYAESDYSFISRMLEDSGITFYFEQDGDEMKLVISDAPQSNAKREVPLTFVDDTTMVKTADLDYATSVRMGQRVRPGKYTMRDHDYRKPSNYKLMSTATKGIGIEEKLERYQYVPGAFLFGTDSGDPSPTADDKGKTRTDEKEAAILAQKRLDAKRGSARVATFETNAHDLAPGLVFSLSGHPSAALADDKTFVVVESSLTGANEGEWAHHCEVRGTDIPFHPELVTPRPSINGVESATVVGPPGEEIHTDEFGRVRVYFHWDRDSNLDDNSSCWIHVSHPWAGAGYGVINVPRVGQEVLVDFLGGDPDRPIIIGRVYTNLQKTPYTLPANKTQSGWRSQSTGQTGGYNEIMFEDASGNEKVSIQAQKDMNKLVKNDESETTGNNRTITVTKNRTLNVGQNDSSTIGSQYSVTIENGGTSITMSKDSIVLATSGATVALGAATIDLSAGRISLAATDISVQATNQVVIDGNAAVLINCTGKPPPDEVQMPSEADGALDILLGLIPGADVLEFGARLIWGDDAVDNVKHQMATGLQDAADGLNDAAVQAGHDARQAINAIF